jgi:hypothetical protein
MPGMYATKVIFGLALLTEGYRFYNQDIQA